MVRLSGFLIVKAPPGSEASGFRRQAAIWRNAISKKISFPISFGFGSWTIFGACGGGQCVSRQSEVVFDIAGNRRSRKRPQIDFIHTGSPRHS